MPTSPIEDLNVVASPSTGRKHSGLNGHHGEQGSFAETSLDTIHTLSQIISPYDCKVSTLQPALHLSSTLPSPSLLLSPGRSRVNVNGEELPGLSGVRPRPGPTYTQSKSRHSISYLSGHRLVTTVTCSVM